MRWFRHWKWCLALVMVLVGLIWLLVSRHPSARERLDEASRAVAIGDFDRALTLYEEILAREPGSIAALMGGGENCLELGRAAQAELYFRRVLERSPECLPAHLKLAYLLGVEGRCWEAAPLLLGSVRQGQFTLHHLVLLGASEPVIADPGFVEKCLRSVPSDPLPLLGVARTRFQQNDVSGAETLLRQIVGGAPSCVEAHAMLGRVLVAARADALIDWQRDLPAEAEAHPEVWWVRGAWADQLHERRGAIRCYAEAVRIDPNHRGANYRLGQLLVSIGQPDQARPFVDRADRLGELVRLVDQVFAQPDSLPHLLRAAELTEWLGRPWEAWGWCEIALRQSPKTDWAAASSRRLRELLQADSPRNVASANPALTLELATYDLPEFVMLDKGHRAAAGHLNSSQNSPSVGHESTFGPVAFKDVAQAAGLDFTYSNRPGVTNGDIRMLETTGGGVAVLDYDSNGFPDLYFTQGSHWPANDSSGELLDQLFRNTGDGHFESVGSAARVGDPRYGQGVTTGDFDNDGFPDLYVANIGENRLYRNNGDGTFSDVSNIAGISGARWTTSCLMADLNGDSWPDIYDVNYLAGEAAATQICRQGAEIRWCSPDAFEAEQDQVYLSLGDGRFENVTRSSGIVVPNGKGLGIVAADIEGTGRLSLFIANDAVANFLFANRTRTSGGPLEFSERGVPSGLAFDRDGLPQACMGVAAGDADGDGLMDLFVTNFADQSNTFYRHLPGHLFDDDTRRAGLRDPSFAMLGFGTQFLDGELDGWQDLVVTNGHVYDLSYKGVPYAMRPQYFRNLGEARFAEMSSHQLGAFFERKSLGRGLARIDWNRDGLEDVVLSHMNSPAALIENCTHSHGHFLAVQLRGTVSSRDAIGATIEVVTPDRTWVRHHSAGDGYQASNDRRLIIGLGDCREVRELKVRWPSGLTQSWKSLAVDQDVVLVEGNSLVVRSLARSR